MKQLRLALHDKINIVNYIVEGYDAEQLEEIREALHKGIEINDNISSVDRELRALQDASKDFQRKYAPEIRNTMDLYLKIESAIYTKGRQLQELFSQKQELLEQQIRH